MPHLGLKGLILLGAFIDVALGTTLLWPNLSRRLCTLVIASSVLVGGLAMMCVQFDPLRMASGVYRSARIMSTDDYTSRFHKDGKTATIDVLEHKSGKLILATNGKVDAAFNPKEALPSPDEVTQALLAILPMAAHPDARQIAVIGMGSGMTSTALLNPQLKRVDTVEIDLSLSTQPNCFGR